ncbi:EscJ/YscJ/HrcJ family type III secretion inner membrane ring protein SsaJ [Citrobacter braakii]|uniref:EscJ/YscJ/HrcJ family type III secretion inner membrane ring protein SsaJ n=1 Tax=Citrobacter braakii TaxID=57706 RepID=UPI00142A73B0|nr:EscJ/YscJ/HrcJ family type III secretion inner membrane ring protein SsaJ [Citrobacter braakii]ECX2002002.1 EscJ/YscJ/HrcJ family type III secretion inner membrane ring protein SsaJ [Salmonella enterica subsp. enterica serovar Newport]MBJ9048910.1 EscJ/YscJ/HrcJ family type III secretion inner membrane ring protein SsaJ [Citrobacter braakii]
MKCLVLVTGLALLLAGCRVELYSAQPEDDANQMLAILLQHHIDADKQPEVGGVTLRVEQSQFINAVELLRLNGFPRRRYVSAETMFPPNQLVVSPAEEQQKIIFLNEQRIERMLSQMDGVIHADVTIAFGSANDDGLIGSASVAVFIKYSPQVNLESFRVQITNLVEKSIPGVKKEHIGILMQPAEFRMQGVANAPTTTPWRAIAWINLHRRALIPSLLLVMLLISLMLIVWRKRS